MTHQRKHKRIMRDRRHFSSKNIGKSYEAGVQFIEISSSDIRNKSISEIKSDVARQLMKEQKLKCDMCGWSGTSKQLYNQKCPKCGSKSVWESGISNTDIGSDFFAGMTHGKSNSMEIVNTPKNTLLVGYGWAVYGKRDKVTGEVTFYKGWDGYSRTTSKQLSQLGLRSAPHISDRRPELNTWSDDKIEAGTQFGVLTPSGKVEKSMSIDIGKVKSSDPLAYSYGYFQGKSGQPMSKDKGLVPEYIRGYKDGKAGKKLETGISNNSFIVKVLPINETEWVGNAMVFATHEEAEQYGSNLYSRWTGITKYRVEESVQKPNYRFIDGKLKAIE